MGEHFTAGLKPTQPGIQTQLGSMLDTGSFSAGFDYDASKPSSDSTRPIYMNGVGLVGWLRELANGEAELVVKDYERDALATMRAGWMRDL